MASLNQLTRELLFKIVFYGPGLGGKTTTLQHVHAASKPEHRGNMVSLATDTDRTLYFDFLPIQVLKLRNMIVRLQLFTVPGQVYYSATRKLVLTGADGIVFVADSQAVRLEANLESLEDLNANLREHGRALSQVPHMFQWNKRDLPDVLPPAELDRRLNLFSAPSVGTIATRGDGVFQALEQITRLVFNAYKAELPKGKPQPAPLFLDAEDVGLSDAIRELADSQARPAVTAAAPNPPVIPLPPESVPTSAPAAPPPPMAGSVGTARPPAGLAPPAPPPPALPTDAATMAAQPPSENAHHAETSPPPPIRTISPTASAQFSLAEMWPEGEREAVRRAESLLLAKDATSAVLACDTLITRALAAASVSLGSTDQARDPALLAVLVGIEGPRYLRFRAAVRAARQKKDVTMQDALECYLLALETRRILGLTI